MNAVKLGRQLASESQLSDALAGVGRVVARGDKIRDVQILIQTYGGKAADWVKMSSSRWSGSDGMQLETHWYENVATGLRTEFKSNFWWK
jgi:hypothetical protein